jgi:hypothetical protein
VVVDGGMLALPIAVGDLPKGKGQPRHLHEGEVTTSPSKLSKPPKFATTMKTSPTNTPTAGSNSSATYPSISSSDSPLTIRLHASCLQTPPPPLPHPVRQRACGCL